MRICRYTLKSGPGPQPPRLGVLDESGVRDVTAATELLPAQRWPLPPGDQFIGSFNSPSRHPSFRVPVSACSHRSPIQANSSAALAIGRTTRRRWDCLASCSSPPAHWPARERAYRYAGLTAPRCMSRSSRSSSASNVPMSSRQKHSTMWPAIAARST
jgi:hypothetical protein